MYGVTTWVDRFWAKVDKTGDCWLWTACRSSGGYGKVGRDGKSLYAHRVIYEELIGPIPDGTEIDHICNTRLCVNPDHLRAVPHRTNILRSSAPTASNAAKTHCLNGHPFDEANTHNLNGGRWCRACGAARARRYRAQKKGSVT